jgi:RNA polymerase sigma factor (sigma-70 family)
LSETWSKYAHGNDAEIEAAYASGHAKIDARLLRLGVLAADVEDLRQEVFLIAAKRHAELGSQATSFAWLGRVCELVALAHRRKAQRRYALPAELFASEASTTFSTPVDAVTSEWAADELHEALGMLSPRDSELLALRLAADVPFRSLAELHDCDVKTARKRFQVAMRRLRQNLLALGALEPAPDSTRARPAPWAVGGSRATLPAIAPTSEVAIGAFERTLILSWRGGFSQRALEAFLGSAESMLKERGPSLNCLSVMEPAWPVPRFEERQRVQQVVRFLDQNCQAVGLIATDHNQRVAEQILTSLGFLQQARYSFGSFNSVESGAGWLTARDQAGAKNAPARASQLVEAVRRTQAQAEPATTPSPTLSERLVHLGMESSVSISAYGDMMVSSWSGPVTQAAVNFMVRTGDKMRQERGRPLAHLSVVEPESPRPRFAERQRLLEIARHCKRNLGGFAFVARVANQRLAEQLMLGMGFLVRSSLVLHAAKSEADGARWLTEHGYGVDPDPARSIELILDALAMARRAREPRTSAPHRA